MDFFKQIEGQWHVQYSNLHMWKNKAVSNLSFNYTRMEKGGQPVLLDEVKYSKNGKQNSIVGYDSPLNAEGSELKWRGKGILMLIVSPWKIEWVSDDKQCMIISFEKTLFTKRGHDIICREKFPKQGVVEEAIAVAKQKKFFEEAEIFRVRQVA